MRAGSRVLDEIHAECRRAIVHTLNVIEGADILTDAGLDGYFLGSTHAEVKEITERLRRLRAVVTEHASRTTQQTESEQI